MKLPPRSKIVMRTKVPVEAIKPWKSKHPETHHYDILLKGNCEVRGPTGEPVVVVLRNVLSKEVVEASKPILHWMRKFTSDNRANYAGAPGGTGKVIRSDGTKSKTNRALNADGSFVQVASMVGGFFEQQGGRFPFCRTTGFTRNHPEKWNALLPLFAECAEVYKLSLPSRYSTQMKVVQDTHQAWLIPDTPFTTITVNNTVAAAYHKDGGDLKSGMGILLAFEQGEFDGFELVIPEYKCAVRLFDGDVLLFNPIIWHGNVPPYNQKGEQDVDWWRTSLVLYYRDGITGCLSPEQEQAKAKQRGAL